MAISFTSNGATPFGIPSQGVGNSTSSGAGRIIAPGAGGVIKGAINSVLAPGLAQSNMGYPSPAANALNTAQSAPAPTTPVKKTTTNNVDGSSTSTEYHAPQTTPTSTAPTTSGVLAPAPTAPTVASPFQVDPSTIGTPGNQQSVSQANSPSGSTSGVLQTNSNGQAIQPNGTTLSGQTPTFGGIVGSLANTSQNGSQNATTATTGLLGAPTQNAALVSEAQDIGNKYSNEANKISNYGNALAGSYTNGAGLAPVSQGLAGIAQNTTANELQGLQSAENLALNPIDKELTAQAQAQAGLQAAGGVANTQQANEQSGLGAAGSLATPSATSAGQTTYNPLTNSFSGGSSQGNPTQAPSGYTQAEWDTIVKNVANGVPNANGSLPAVLQAQAQAAAQAQNPNFNYATAVGQAAGQQAVGAAGGTTQAQNIATSGTATTGANATGLAQSIQQETALNTAASNATALATQVQTALQNSGLNLTNSTDANTAINNLQSRLGNAGYTQLNIAVNDARNAYQAILTATGATPTDAGTAANQNINANMSPKQILAAIDQLSQGVNARQTSQHAQTLEYQKQLNESGTSSNTGTSNTPSTSGFGWNG